MFTIYYQDGRVEGPLSAQVVKDLLKVGVIQNHDRVAHEQGNPLPVSAYPEFAALLGGSPAGGLQPMPGGLQPMPGGPASNPVNEDATMQMSIGAFHPMAIQAEVEKRKAATRQKRATGLLQAIQPPPQQSAPVIPSAQPVPPQHTPPAQQAQAVPENVDSFVDDLFASMSGSVEHRPIQGNSYSSGSFQVPSAISVKNPFAGRQTGPQSAVSGNPDEDHGFDEKLIRLSATEIRDRLLSMNLFDILGTHERSNRPTIQEHYARRYTQISEHPDAQGGSIIGRAAIEDLTNILLQTRDVLADAERLQPYKGTNSPPFNQFINFSFSPVKPITTSLDGPAPMEGVDTDASAGRDYSGLPSLSDASASNMSNGGLSGLSGSLSGPAATSGAFARTSGNNARPSNRSTTPQRPKTKAQLAQDRRKAQFKKGFAEDGDPFEGELVFQVGENDRGIKHVLPIYALVFIVSFVLITFTGMGKDEFKIVAGDMMLFVRSALLLIAALVGIMVVRKESFSRLGFSEINPLAALAALPVGLILGIACMTVAQLPIPTGSSFGLVLGLLAVRCIGEVTFFQGFVARTLLVEFKQYPVALLVSSLLYGLYTMTYVDMLNGHPLNIVFAICVYGFGAGIPYSLLYFKSKSILAPFFAHFLVLAMAAYAGLQHSSMVTP